MSKAADLWRLRKAKSEHDDGRAFMLSLNKVFNGMIDQLRAEKAKNARLRETIKRLMNQPDDKSDSRQNDSLHTR